MNIKDIIREKRLAKGFTQEQIANYLGVSAPAVNNTHVMANDPIRKILHIFALTG